MSLINVTPTNKGWVVTKDGRSVVIKDNGDGILGDGDNLSQTLSGSGFTQEDIKLAASQVNNQTTQTQQGQAPTKKKSGNFFSKVGNFFTGFLTGGFSMLGMGMGLGGDIWSRNITGGVGFNDMQVGLYANSPARFGSSIGNFVGNMGYNPLSMNNNAGGLGGVNFGSLMQNMDKIMANQDKLYQNTRTSVRTRQVNESFDRVKGQYEKFKENPEKINSENFSTFEEILNNAEGNEKEFSKEDMATIDTIFNAPLVNEKIVQKADNEENKIPLEKAMKISALLEKYNSAASGEKEEILSTEKHQKLTELLAKESLTPDDMKEINELV